MHHHQYTGPQSGWTLFCLSAHSNDAPPASVPLHSVCHAAARGIIAAATGEIVVGSMEGLL